MNLHPIELHATFEEGQALPPTGAAARPSGSSGALHAGGGGGLHYMSVSEPHVVQFPPFGDGEITV